MTCCPHPEGASVQEPGSMMSLLCWHFTLLLNISHHIVMCKHTSLQWSSESLPVLVTRWVPFSFLWKVTVKQTIGCGASRPNLCPRTSGSSCNPSLSGWWCWTTLSGTQVRRWRRVWVGLWLSTSPLLTSSKIHLLLISGFGVDAVSRLASVLIGVRTHAAELGLGLLLQLAAYRDLSHLC